MIRLTAPSHEETVSAMKSIQRMPQSITASGTAASPSGARISATTAAGITRLPITGTAATLAMRPKSEMRLKCAAATGAVAIPAIAEESTTVAAARRAGGQRSMRRSRRRIENTATRAVVAAKDI